MAETKFPEVDVSEFLTQMRTRLPAGSAGAPPSRVIQQVTAEKKPSAWNQVTPHIALAEEHLDVGKAIPQLKRLPTPLRQAARSAAGAVLYVLRVITKKQGQVNLGIVRALHAIGQPVRALEQTQRHHGDSLRHLQQRVEELETQVAAQREREAALPGQLSDMVKALQNQVAAVQGSLQSYLQSSLQAQATDLKEKEARLVQLTRTVGHLRSSVLVQEGRVNLVLEEARKRLPGPWGPEQLQPLADQEEHALDALYLAFEDQFRGTREDIKGRLRIYLPRVKEAAGGGAVLDIGCGRGEWLELLGEEGVAARGLDSNRTMVEDCRRRGLEAEQGDALAHLRGLPDCSLGAITGFHIIEHLPWGTLIKLMDEVVRVLKPGGVAIFETPNPENILIGACYFHSDPTHRNPLFPPTVQFLAEQRGLVGVEILRLADHLWRQDFLKDLPAEHPLAPVINPLVEVSRDYFFAPGDYAVIGRKAA